MGPRPINDRVVVRLDKSDEVTAGGIFIAKQEDHKPESGVVVAVGEGRETKDGTRIPLSVKPGDKVMFSKHAGQPVKYNDEVLHVIIEDDILVVMED